MDDSTPGDGRAGAAVDGADVFVLAVVEGARPNEVYRLLGPETVVGRGGEAALR